MKWLFCFRKRVVTTLPNPKRTKITGTNENHLNPLAGYLESNFLAHLSKKKLNVPNINDYSDAI